MARTKAFIPEERLELAKAVFWEKGYQATSMQDLVNSTGLNRGSIYDTYGDKHSLFLQCLLSYNTSILELYDQLATESRSPMKLLEKLVSYEVARAISDGKTCLGVKSVFELAAVDEEVHTILKDHTLKVLAIVSGLLRKAQKAGEIKAKRDPEALARFVIGNFSGFSQLFLLFGKPEVVFAQADLLIRAIKK